MDPDNHEPKRTISEFSNEASRGNDRSIHRFDVSGRQMISKAAVPAGFNDDTSKSPIDPLKDPSAGSINVTPNKATKINIGPNTQPVTSLPAEKKPMDESSASDNPTLKAPDDISRVVEEKKVVPSNMVAEQSSEANSSREQQIQEYIKSRKFFVPINSIAQKKSVKVSAGLTLLVFILSLILFDLMLDSRVILLVQKIPHTHFFTQNSGI